MTGANTVRDQFSNNWSKIYYHFSFKLTNHSHSYTGKKLISPVILMLMFPVILMANTKYGSFLFPILCPILYLETSLPLGHFAL